MIKGTIATIDTIGMPSHFLKELDKHTLEHAKIKVNTTSSYNVSPATSFKLKDNVLNVFH